MEKKLVFLPFIYFNFCNAGLVSATQQCESVISIHTHTHTHIFSPLSLHPTTLSHQHFENSNFPHLFLTQVLTFLG